ncbi:MAG: murein biosynthesis integral membrane protein MurJ [Deltaproteobacteria bacterium]|nr:murein biosynthesis integral membrane protein MurJ [Deltaproteobacteria bacterium]
MTNTGETNSKTLLRGTGITGAYTLISRIFGFIRDLLTAHLFGAGIVADAFFVAFRIPNLLRSFLAEGAMTSAFVPVFAEELIIGKDRAREAIRSIFGLLIVVTLVLTALGIIYSREIVFLIAPGFENNPSQSELCVRLLQVMFPFIICISLVSIVSAALNTLHIFGTAALSQCWMNGVLIVAALLAHLFGDTVAAYILSVSVVIGGLVQIIVQLPALKSVGLLCFPSLHIFTKQTKKILLLLLPAILGAAVYQLQIFLNTLIASYLPTGSISWLFYADRLVQLPIGIFTLALASVLLPILARSHAQNSHDEYGTALVDSLKFVSYFIIPISCLLYFLAKPLCIFLFQRGAFSANSSIMTAQAVQAYGIGLWSVSCGSLLSRAFIARKNTIIPTLIGCLTLITTFVLSVHLVGPLNLVTHDWFGQKILTLQRSLSAFIDPMSLAHAGLAYASSISAILSMLVFAVVLGVKCRIPWLMFIAATIRSLVASILAMLAADTVIRALEITVFLELAIGGIIFGLIWMILHMLMRTPEHLITVAAIKLKLLRK